MAEDWDLFAIVRSCQSATNTATTESTPPTNTISTQDTTSSFATSIVKEEYDSFSFPNLVQPITSEFQELNQLFAPLNPTTNTTTTSGLGIKPNSPFSEFAGSIGQQEEKMQQSEHLPMLAPAATIHTTIWSHFEPEASTSGFNRFHHYQQQQQQHVQQQQNQLQLVQKQESLVPQISSSAIVLPNTQPQTPRSRKRKSEQKKMVCQVTADKLSTDLWAWRKYGQKPIKGSPYPRNYYRCSSSKGCAARKQVERSNAEADMYIVTYTGDHLHPRPTHRNSLTGTTRSKSPTRNPPPATHGSSGSLSIEPNTSSSLSAPAQSPMMPSADPPENDVAEKESETESPDLEIDADVDAGGDVDIFPPTPEALPRNILLGLGHFYGANGGGADASSPKSQPGSNLG